MFHITFQVNQCSSVTHQQLQFSNSEKIYESGQKSRVFGKGTCSTFSINLHEAESKHVAYPIAVERCEET